MADKTASIESDAEGSDLTPETKASLTAKIEQLKHALAESHLAQQCRQVSGRVDESVREKPYHYVAGAAVVGLVAGLVAGLVIARRSD